MDGLNPYRTARVGEVLQDFRELQLFISDAPVNPDNMDEYYTEGWAVLRQCHIDGQHILNCGADTSIPQSNGHPEEQAKAELKQVLVDAYARRHEAQKIYLRQAAARQWIELRQQILRGGRPHSSNHSQLRDCDQYLRTNLESITDEYIYNELKSSDMGMGRWTDEDPSLRAVQRWIRTRLRSTTVPH